MRDQYKPWNTRGEIAANDTIHFWVISSLAIFLFPMIFLYIIHDSQSYIYSLESYWKFGMCPPVLGEQETM